MAWCPWRAWRAAYASVRRGVHVLARLDTAVGALCVVYALFVGTLPTGGSCAVAFLAGLLGGAAGVEKKPAKKVICIVHSTKARNDAQTDEEGF